MTPLPRLVEMLAQGSSEATQNEAAAALGDLARNPDQSAQIGAAPDAIPRLVTLLEIEGVRFSASSALCRLALDPFNAERIEEFADSIPRLVPLLATGTPFAVQLNAIMILCAVVSPMTAGRLAASVGAIPALVKLLYGSTQMYAVGLLLVIVETGENADRVGVELAAAGAMPILAAIREAGLPHVKRFAAAILTHLM
jgi:hypothetical protein